MRFTTNTPTTNLESALNLFFIKDHQAYVRGGGPEPDYKDVSLCDFIRRIIKTHDLDIPAADNEELSEAAFERLFDGTDTMEGVVALLYTAGWAFAEIRGRLEKYEDTGIEPGAIADAARWIPVTERLPKTDGRFMVTIKGRSGKPHVEMRNFHAGSQKWESQLGWGEENILAWQQRPKPYDKKKEK